MQANENEQEKMTLVYAITNASQIRDIFQFQLIATLFRHVLDVAASTWACLAIIVVVVVVVLLIIIMLA